MTMKQKKKIEVEKSMVNDNRKKYWINFATEVLCAGLLAVGCVGIWWWQKGDPVKLISDIVLLEIGMGAIGFHARQCRIGNEFDYDNGEHIGRFWLSFLLGMAVAFASVFLPVAGWPFLAVYVVLSLFSNLGLGVLSGTVLLLIPVLLGGQPMSVFILYFLSSVFGVTLFHRLDEEFHTGIPLFLSLFGLLLAEVAGIILQQNARLGLEMFVIPITNMIVTGIFLTGILRWFANAVAFQYRLQYLELNDTEYPFLKESLDSSRKVYLSAVHTAYFCERIAGVLGMDKDAMKCAGYYHGLQEKKTMEEWQCLLPPPAYSILTDYWDHHAVVR